MSHLISESNVEKNAAANSPINAASEVTDSLNATCQSCAGVDSNFSGVDNAALASAQHIAEVNQLDQGTMSGQQTLYAYWQLVYQRLVPVKGKAK